MASLIAAGAALALFVLVWLGSVMLRDASLVDRFWGVAFIVIVGAFVWRRGVPHDAGLASAILTTIWGVRLSLYLTIRNWGHGEDRRYAKMRADIGPRFWIVSLFSVFALQALIASVVSLPVQSAIGFDHSMGALEWIGVALFIVGFAFEAIADAQLARFLRSHDSKDKVMDRGLWSWSRHPNYFGEMVLWWGLGLLGVRGNYFGWCLIGPLAITFLLLKVSGVVMLEKTIGKRRPGYDEYVRKTSAFIPLPPRG